MNRFIRCRWFVSGGWRLAFQHIAGKLVVNILKLMDGLDVGLGSGPGKRAGLAAWLEYIANQPGTAADK